MSVINTNYLSLVAQNNLNSSQSSLGTAIERLSSGLRINSAKDDAAGEAIANRFTANVNGLTQAARNANDGISIAQTTEGSLDEINNNLQRIRELTVQAQNGTNSTSDLASIQAEITQRLNEITRVSDQTQFNGVKVLAKDQSLTIQVGANDNETISINLKQINASTLGLGSFDVTKSLATGNVDATAVTQTVAATVDVTALNFSDSNAASTWSVYVDNANPDKLYVSADGSNLYAATYDASTNSLKFDSSGATVASSAATAATSGTDVHVGGGAIMKVSDIANRTDANVAAKPELHLDASGNYHVKVAGGYTSATVDASSGVVTYNSAAAASSAGTTIGTSLKQIDVPGTATNVDLSGVTATAGAGASLHKLKDGSGYVVEGTDANGNTAYYSATVDQTTGKVTLGDQYTADPLDALDKALATVDDFRSDLGAIQNRFESTIANLNNTVTNLSAARSRIQDADYATEVSNMTRAQILQQAGTSVLAQANQVPQTVLSLLR